MAFTVLLLRPSRFACLEGRRSCAWLHEGHDPICPAKRDWLVMLDDETCPGKQGAESPIQVRKQRLRDRVEQLTLQRGVFLVPQELVEDRNPTPKSQYPNSL